MKSLFATLMSLIVIGLFPIEVSAQSQTQNISFRRKAIKSQGHIYKAPYHGDLVTLFDGGNAETFTLWFHYAAENAEVIITKDGETVADETFSMAANELLECDFSACESGEYTVSVVANGEIDIIFAYSVY